MIAPQSYDHILLVCGRKTFDSDRNESFANYKDLISLIDADEMLKSSDLGPNLQSIHNCKFFFINHKETEKSRKKHLKKKKMRLDLIVNETSIKYINIIITI